MNLRKIGYNIISKLKSSPVNDFITEFHMSNEEKEELSKRRLKNILEIAREKTNFYSDYDYFYDFPIISKEILRERYDDFLSVDLDKEKAIETTTSGSSGQPMSFYLSRRKKYRQNAEVIFYNRWANIDIGDHHGYVRVTELKSKIKLFLQNEVLMNPKNLTDEWLEEQVNLLIQKRIKGLIGYPSAILAIAHASIDKGIEREKFSLEGIITTGENLKENDIKVIERAFGVKPISRYSTEEFGVIATSCPHCGKFHVNDTGYKVEVLDLNENKPVQVGDFGRVVVTDLFSDNMPLIRFDTGDIAVYGGDSTCSFYPTGVILNSIAGRQIETVYDINEKAISAFAINGALRDFKTIKRYQFIQNSPKDNKILLVVNREFNPNDKMLIEDRFTNLLGKEPKISIVENLPALKSGKRPYIINNYRK